MPRFAWKEFLTEWSREVLQYPEFVQDFMTGEALFYIDEHPGIQPPPLQAAV